MISSLEELARAKSEPKTILLVDDDEDTRTIFSVLARPFNCRWEAASTCEEAMELVRVTQYNLVLLDLKMPGLDGPHCFAKLKATRRAQPIVVMSGYIDSDVIRRIQAIGFAVFAAKPACFSTEFFDEMMAVFGVHKRA